MSKRVLKNPFTILEKVKKGEIVRQRSFDDDEYESLFSRVRFYKKPDLIKPHLHYLDEHRVKAIVDNIQMAPKQKQYQQEIENWINIKQSEFKRKVDILAFHKKMVDNYERIPKHLISDVFKMYYNRIEKLEFEDRDEKNVCRYKFLEKSNNPVGKIMSEMSNLKSAIFTKNTILYYLIEISKLDFLDPETSKSVKNSLNDDFKNPSSSEDDASSSENVAEKMDNLLKGNEPLFEKLMDEAQQMCDILDKNMDAETQEQIFENIEKGEGIGTSHLNVDSLMNLGETIESVALNTDSLKPILTKILDDSKNLFSSKKETVFEDMFTNPNLNAVEEYEFLHPKLRKFMAEDIVVRDHKTIGKINVYLDISGSMSSRSGALNTKGKEITNLDFGKSVLAKFHKMDILKNVYVFNSYVHPVKNKLINICMISSGGGTSITRVVDHAKQTNENAIIITDAQDSLEVYYNKAYFIGVTGANFRHFSKETLKQYSEKRQMVQFDGKGIRYINESGYAV